MRRNNDDKYDGPRQFRVPLHWIGARIPEGLDELSLAESLISLPPELLKTHALCIGATGSGKTNLLHHLIAQDIMFGHSFAILDMRGDLVNAALELCAGRVDPRKVVLIDLRDKNAPVGFDPLYGAGEAYFRALGVLDAVEGEWESLGPQLTETMRYGLMLLAEAGAAITELERLFYEPDFLAACLERCSSGPVLSFFGRFSELSSERRANFAGPVLNKLAALLATDRLRNVLGHASPVDLAAHLATPGSVTLISLAVDELHSSGRMFGRIFLASFCREIFARVARSEQGRVPIRLFIDEFEHFVSKEFESILAEGRKFKLSLVLAHQTLAQLSTNLRSLILGNVGTKLVFRTGREDGPILSRDLTGDTAAFDFADFQTGEALMWNRGGALTHLQVNEPIVRDAGSLSGRARAFVQAIHGDGNPPPQSASRVRIRPTTPSRPARQEPPTTNRRLEELLCD